MDRIFYGTKEVYAVGMNRQAYNDYRGWDLPADEDGSDEGYVVEYLDGGQSNHPQHRGYISWSPADVFNKSYQASGNLSFGHALVALKEGRRVSRKGWNGKDMWLSLSCGETKTLAPDQFWSKHNAQHARDSGGLAKVLPSITMKTADGSILMGWLASQTDMLAEDWCIV